MVPPAHTSARAEGVLADRYELRGLLATGGMATVHDGWDQRLDRQVAVKILLPELAAHDGIRRRFEAEAASAAGLDHPNIVRVFDCGEDDGRPFIVLERLPGRTLADEMATGAMPLERVRLAGAEILAGLEAAHARGLIHRDIKPANLLRAADGSVKIADFGIARSAGDDDRTTGLVLGTPAYLAPERLAGAAATPQADLYAVGVVLAELATGERYRPGGAGLPPRLRDIVERATAADAGERYGSAGEMAAALASWQPDVDRTVAVEAGATEMLPLPDTAGAADTARRVGAAGLAGMAGAVGRRRPAVVAVAAAAVVLLVLALLVVSGGGDDEAPAAPPDGLGPALDRLDEAVR